MSDIKNAVLVAGASGLVGAAAIESFLASGWDLIGISRRRLRAEPITADVRCYVGKFFRDSTIPQRRNKWRNGSS
jgi:uncharacterized protein YbjT (DUF2867 family)